MVFSDGSLRSIEGIIKVFDEYAAISGLKISIEKTTLFLAGMSQEAQDEITEQFPFSRGSLPVRYLGLPLMTKHMKKEDYCYLVEKVRTRLQSWKTKFLSFAGRLQMISSVIYSIMNFWLSAFRLPSSCIDELERLCSGFLWSGSNLNTRKVKIAWSDVCTKRSEGGLGLRRLKEVNKVLCLKLVWRIVSAKSLWVDWVQEYLIQKGSFWSISDTGNSGSWIWKKILKYRSIAEDFHRVEVGNGERSYFWFDNWSELGRLWYITGCRGTIDMGIAKEARISEISNHRRRRNHRVPVLNQIENALALVLNSNDREDICLWRNSKGEYKTVFSAKETWESLREVRPLVHWHRGIWFKQATPKFSFVAWLAIRNRLATGDRMLKWNSSIDPTCVLCLGDVDSIKHLFFGCSYSSTVWSILVRGLMLQRYTTDWNELLNCIVDSSQDKVYLFLLKYSFQAAIHLLWQERNRRKHGEKPKDPSTLANMLSTIIQNRIRSIRGEGKGLEEVMIRWYTSRI